MKILCLTPGRHVPSARFRIGQYVRHLRRLGHQCVVAPSHPAMYEHYRWLGWRASQVLRRWWRNWDVLRAQWGRFDVAVVQRELFDDDSADFERRFRSACRALVLDVDDGVFLRHPEKFEQVARMSDAIIAGNRFLAEKAQEYNAHVTLIPTTVDLDRYPLKRAAETPPQAPVIGWTGTSGNLAQLRLVRDPLCELATRAKFELRVISDRQEPLRELEFESVNVRFVPWRERTEFKDLLAFDVGIMPLEDTAWSRYKCGLKILQYMAIGIPAVASPVGVNSDIVRSGENGFLPESSTDWTQVLQRLTSHQELRLRIGAAGRRTVEQSYSVESQLPRLVEVLAGAVSRTSRISGTT